MPKTDYIPSLASLAFQYGTITKHQFQQFSSFVSGRQISNGKEAELLLKQGLATRSQIGLLKLIMDYQIIKAKGEIFGRIAVEKGYVTDKDIKKALAIQREAFRRSRMKKLVGDILVDRKIITEDQKSVILGEQTRLEIQDRKEEIDTGRPKDNGIDLSSYEKEFLKIKALDEDFSAAIVEKGLAKEEDVSQARQVQDRAFEQESTIKILGDIMVELNMISKEQKEIIFREQGRGSEAEEKRGFRVSISEDQMSAWLVRENRKEPIPLARVKEALKQAGIIGGIYPDSFLQCALEHETKKIPLAKRDYSQLLKETYGLTSHLDQGLSESGEKKKGDLLAEERGDAEPPGPVENIMGKPSRRVSDNDFTVRCGSGSRKSRNGSRIVAAKTGKPVLSVERLLYVHPAIHALEDVDQRYGPVEPFANLTVSGTITGAYPITAGDVTAREIRGGRIEAIGNISTEVGITDAVIRAQGDVKARYLHNCKIELFGNLHVENEIFDSEIKCSGKIDCPECRVVTSRIYAKQGVVLGGTGSAKTQPCLVAAGTEHHLFSQLTRVMDEIDAVEKAFDRLVEKKEEKRQQSRSTFEKMVELKIFHDRARQTKQILCRDLKAKKKGYAADKQKNIEDLIANCDHRMEKTIQTLKDLNGSKKKHDKGLRILTEKIDRLRSIIQRQVKGFEQTIFAYLEWARFQPGSPRIEIRGTAFHGTVFRGVWSEMTLASDMNDLVVNEKGREPGNSEMMIN